MQPSRRDRRFADSGWAGKLRRAMQAYLAAAQTAEGVVAEAGLDEKDAERVGFVLTNMIDALAPSNNPLLIVPPQVFMISWRNPDTRYETRSRPCRRSSSAAPSPASGLSLRTDSGRLEH